MSVSPCSRFFRQRRRGRAGLTSVETRAHPYFVAPLRAGYSIRVPFVWRVFRQWFKTYFGIRCESGRPPMSYNVAQRRFTQ